MANWLTVSPTSGENNYILNLTADTNMRNSISVKKEEKPKQGGDKPSGFGGLNE